MKRAIITILSALILLILLSQNVAAEEKGIDPRALHHIHLQSFDEAGQPNIGAMNDGLPKDLTFFLTNAGGDFLWQICPAKHVSNDVNKHYVAPSYGQPVAGNCPNFGALTHWGEEGWHYTEELSPGIYKIVAKKVVDDLPKVPDATTAYYGVLTITIINSQKYTYASAQPQPNEAGTGYEEGSSQPVEFAVSSSDCAANPACAGDKGYVFNIFSQKKTTLDGVLEELTLSLLKSTLQILDKLGDFLLTLIIIPHSFFEAGSGSGVVKAWEAARAVTNVILVLALIIIALANIMRLNIEQYDIFVAIPRLILVAIAANLSLLITGAVVDFGNVLTVTFQAENARVLTSSNIILGNSDFGSGLAAFLFWLLLVVIGLIAVLWLVLVLAFRVAVILFLVIMSPIGIFFYSLPMFAPALKAWRGTFLKYVFIGPIISAILWAASTIIGSFTTGGPVPALFQYFLPLSLIILAGMVPLALGGRIMASFAGMAKGRAGWLYRASGLEKAFKTRREFREAGRGARALSGLSRLPLPFTKQTRDLMLAQSHNIRGKQAKEIADVTSVPDAMDAFKSPIAGGRRLSPITELAYAKAAAGFIHAGDEKRYPRFERAVKNWINYDEDLRKRVRESTPHILARIGQHGLFRATIEGTTVEKMSGWGAGEINHLHSTMTEGGGGSKIRALSLITKEQVTQAFNPARSNTKLRRQFIEAYREGKLNKEQVEGLKRGLKQWDETL